MCCFLECVRVCVSVCLSVRPSVLSSSAYPVSRYSTVGRRRTARLEFHPKIRTTPAWKNELRTVSHVCLEDDFFGGIADFETTPRLRVETFQPLPWPGVHMSV